MEPRDSSFLLNREQTDKPFPICRNLHLLSPPLIDLGKCSQKHSMSPPLVEIGGLGGIATLKKQVIYTLINDPELNEWSS